MSLARSGVLEGDSVFGADYSHLLVYLDDVSERLWLDPIMTSSGEITAATKVLI